VGKSVNTSTVHVCTVCETKSLCKNKGVTVIHFLVVQTATISVATAGDFLLDPGFSCFILDLFDSNQILEIYVVVLYFHSRIQ